ncbi:putative Protein OPI10-like protein [Hypsibius exemplaris]|uniref:Uncharacterized protein n=1 Tax=Hypsibius exemplaris TaxID=2072580 RepID=A0A1W0WJQ1_HYPEX|nr:putative Protein OPI10-like protein [Hypsibius exemplaris]
MIGLIVSGRPAQSFESVPGDATQTRFISTITDADSINHIVVFLSQPLPEGVGAGVHFSWPGAGSAAQEWTYLGCLTNAKPSAIYKIVKPKRLDPAEGSGDSIQQPQSPAIVMFGGAPNPHLAAVGVSLEPLTALESMQLPPTDAVQKTNLQEFCGKMLDSFVNYAMSFAVANPANPNDVYVPMKTITGWFEKYKRRLETDPNFWKSSS